MTHEYREGDAEMKEPEMTETVEAPVEETSNVTSLPKKEDAQKEPEGPRAFTAVLLLQFPDGKVDAITDLPNMNTDHPASLREVRSMCQNMVMDVNNMIQAKIVMNELQVEGAKRQLASQIEGMKNKLKV
jgi:hypothetical protein